MRVKGVAIIHHQYGLLSLRNKNALNHWERSGRKNTTRIPGENHSRILVCSNWVSLLHRGGIDTYGKTVGKTRTGGKLSGREENRLGGDLHVRRTNQSA